MDLTSSGKKQHKIEDNKVENNNPPTSSIPNPMPLPLFLDLKADDDELKRHQYQFDMEYTKKIILDDIQANIIKPTHHKYTLHCFLTFGSTSDDEESKKGYKRDIVNWLKNLPLTSASEQETWEKEGKNDTPIISLFLSFDGYNFFYNQEQIKQFISADDEPLIAFKEGLAKRCPRAFGKENEHIKLDKNFKNPIHALLLIATNDDQLAVWNKETNKNKKRDELFSFFKKVTCKQSQNGQLSCPEFSSLFFEIGMRNPEGSDQSSREWFGFRDGISNPHFFSKPNSSPTQKSLDETDKLSIVLRRSRLSPRPYGCGSFVVFLKMEQDVDAFNEKVEQLAKSLNKEDYKGYAAAYLMGRHKNGAPLHPKYNSPFEQKRLNDFDFKNVDLDGKVCPFHAHTRKANPRDGTEKKIVRRGKIYGQKDSSEKGILFLSYQSSLLNFEHIVNNGLYAFNHQSKNIGQDALFANQKEFQTGHKYVNASGQTVSTYAGSNGELVKFKGGLYFYASSISFIKYNLENCM
jgi:Dyp-type peroxidase family